MKPQVVWTLSLVALLVAGTLGCSPSEPTETPQAPAPGDAADNPPSSPTSPPSDQRGQAAVSELEGPVSTTTVAPEEPPTLAQVNEGTYAFAFRLKNTGSDTIVVWPYLSIKIMNSAGEEVQEATNIGRWGLRLSPSRLEAISFVTLNAGQTHDITVNLKRYTHDPDFITGWQLPEAGEYDLLLSYKFDRADVKEKYGKGCTDIDGANKPWNQAIEMEKTSKLKLLVQ